VPTGTSVDVVCISETHVFPISASPFHDGLSAALAYDPWSALMIGSDFVRELFADSFPTSVNILLNITVITRLACASVHASFSSPCDAAHASIQLSPSAVLFDPRPVRFIHAEDRVTVVVA